VRFDKQAVHLRSTISQPVDRVLARHTNNAFVPCLLRIDLGVENLLVGSRRDSQCFTVRRTNTAAPDKLEATLGSHTIDRREVNGILHRTSRNDVLGHAFGSGRPVRR
jgi:hypothetical protein